jgi:uncharacterized membrane protein
VTPRVLDGVGLIWVYSYFLVFNYSKLDSHTEAPRRMINVLNLILIFLAGIFYSLHIHRPLDSSEAYSALAANQPDYSDVIRNTARFDPGKPALYQTMLHTLDLLLGSSEVSLRVPSVAFSMLSLGLLMALGGEMFTPGIGLSATLMWALNPLAILFAGWARVYALLMALFLGQLLTMWKLWRGSASVGTVIACGLFGAGMLYAHLCSALILGAEIALLVGAAWRGGRPHGPWIALALSITLFAPFGPIAVRQTHTIFASHFIDWIGVQGQTNVLYQAGAVLAVAAVVLALAFAPRFEADKHEPIRWCLGIGLIPALLLLGGSVAVRPMFAIRYVSPSLAILVLLLARLLASLGVRTFRLSTVGVTAFMAFLYPCYAWYVPWRDVARIVASGSPSEPVFFEPIFTDRRDPLADHGEGFPQGFLRPAFDHYFSGPNPRRMVDPSKPAQTRRIIAQAAARAHGAWLVTTSDMQTARAELPTDCFHIETMVAAADGTLLHVVPLPPNHCGGSR